MSDQPTILICDDEPHILHVVGLKLRDAGYHVLTAGSGREGLRLARRHRPELVLTDLKMPGMDGLELCGALRADPLTSAARLVVLTARGGSLDPQVIQAHGLAAVFSKPFSPRELLTCVKQLVPATPTSPKGQTR